MTETASQFVGSIPEHYDTGLGPVIFEGYASDIARRAARKAPGRVLELAAGTGIVSRRLRDTLPAGTRLTVTDLNPPMLAIAQAKFAPGEAVAFAEADATALPFEAESFDAIVCQFGVMFFPDKRAAFAEAARVLVHEGRYFLNTWSAMSENPFSAIADGLAREFFPEDPPAFYQMPFSYPDPAAVVADMEASGFAEVRAETVVLERRVEDPAAFARGLVRGNPFIIEIEERRTVPAAEVEAAMVEALQARFGRAPFTMPLSATVFEGIRA